EIEQASEADEIIQAVRQGLEKDVWSEDTSSFKTFSTELCFADKILLRGTRIVIPNLLRERTLHLAHEGHPGMTIMKQRLRAKVWWPKLDQQVENYVKKCKGCMMVSIPSAPEPMIRRELPSAPWQHVAIDFLGPLPSGHSLLVVVDYFSRYIEVEIMKKIDSTETIKRLNPIFARFGLPLSITADNGPQFSSDEFKVYCNHLRIQQLKEHHQKCFCHTIFVIDFHLFMNQKLQTKKYQTVIKFQKKKANYTQINAGTLNVTL
uniref:Uncharacterized protein n=1 Tax=Anopheles stephensi TaxID=30069 RepID=A0A182YRT6_ANOST